MSDSVSSIDEVMYHCGAQCLHPGGLKKTEELLEACHIVPGLKILDFGCGRGYSACYIAKNFNCKVVGIDSSARMVQTARRYTKEQKLEHLVDIHQADILKLPFEAGSFDILLAECVLTLTDTPRALSEMYRAVKQGGWMGTIEMMWLPSVPRVVEQKAATIWDGFQSRTLEQWYGLFCQLGLRDVRAVDFSEQIPSMASQYAKDFGVPGLLNLLRILIKTPPLLSSMFQYGKFFTQYSDYIGYGYFAGKK
jgi:cyclopropane fatty-acyl-phospholipid synthase-like methyltransferase